MFNHCQSISKRNKNIFNFILTVNKIIHYYIDIQNQLSRIIKQFKLTIYQQLTFTENKISHLNNLKRHQLELIRFNEKLCFYTIFKTDVSKYRY